jgi:Tol biopolymer transport system component
VGCAGLRPVLDRPLPPRDIVFQVSSGDLGDEHRVGFIDGDGSGLTYVTVTSRVSPVVRPAWTPDGTLLVFRNYHRYQLVAAGHRELRQFKTDAHSMAAPTGTGHEVVIALNAGGVAHIMTYDLDAGDIVKLLEGAEERGVSLGTNPLHDGLLVYVRSAGPNPECGRTEYVYEVVLLDTGPRAERVLVRSSGAGSEAILEAPAFSPDGEWIAYTAADGIYLMHADGSDPRRVAQVDMLRDCGDGTFGCWDDSPPRASWSPDSRWLVYHRCRVPAPDTCVGGADDHNIYKLNVETGEETLLVEGGLNPYWRLAQ